MFTLYPQSNKLFPRLLENWTDHFLNYHRKKKSHLHWRMHSREIACKDHPFTSPYLADSGFPASFWKPFSHPQGWIRFSTVWSHSIWHNVCVECRDHHITANFSLVWNSSKVVHRTLCCRLGIVFTSPNFLVFWELCC